jgi:uncharacterized protein (DUF2267 family)
VRDGEFLFAVRGRSGLASPRAARRAIRVVLFTFGELLPDGWVDHLAVDLPVGVGRQLRLGNRRGYPGEMRCDGLLHRIRRRASLSPAQAERLARAVVTTLAEACDPALVRRVGASLPDDIRTRLWAVRPDPVGRRESLFRPLGTGGRSGAAGDDDLIDVEFTAR